MKEITGPLAAASIVRPRARRSLRDYLAVTKPRHVLPSTLTAWIGMLLAAREPLPTGLVAATLTGTALAVAASHVFNAVLDKDLDALMDRTRDRPLPAGRMGVVHAVAYGGVLAAAALVVLAWGVNGLAALLALGGLLFYDGVYTYWLKRRTPWNTLVGGVAGGVPPLIGWAATTGALSWPALILFVIMLVWQPLHFFALSLLVADDYRRAGFPMVVVVQGEQATLNQIAAYSGVLVAASVLLYVLGTTGPVYLGAALVLGAIYVGAAFRAAKEGPARARFWGRWLLRYAFVYLTVLLVVAILNRAA